MNRGSTGMNRGSIGDDMDEPGKTGAPPGNDDRRGTGNNRDGTGNNRDGTNPAEVRQSPGECLDCIRKQALCRNATGIHRGSAEALPATTGLKPGRIDTVSAGGVTVYRGSAGFHRGSTGALPAITGAMPERCRLSPGHYRRQPGFCRGFTWINRLCRAVDRLQPGGTGK
ncbi:hypothetical protein DPMN_138539 [Dreissena polymorpha]|uniref:Uncharacterized protein n=1 Tax=Dreissena polymorpha TaxID=45954 RepID=A0A9D4JIN7_DREPO|nr:hypothetical protein DPMN_138539 [Dreissena polymorpha]